MNEIIGDITKIKKGIICHQTNCVGKMGTGIAYSIKQAFPRVYDLYLLRIKNLGPTNLLGKVQTIKVDTDLFVANVFGQLRYGREQRHTDYNAVRSAFTRLEEARNTLPQFSNIQQSEIYIPYKMGCVNAGGDWKIYLQIIKEIIPYATIVRLNSD